jgi:hypothetical protein
MTTVRVATFRRAGGAAGDPRSAAAAGAREGGTDPDRRVRRLRHRSAHPERALAEAAALAVHARPRARGRDRRDRPGAHPRLDRPAARGRRQGHAAAAHALRHLLLVHPLPRDRQQVPHAGLLQAAISASGGRRTSGAASPRWSMSTSRSCRAPRSTGCRTTCRCVSRRCRSRSPRASAPFPARSGSALFPGVLRW